MKKALVVIEAFLGRVVGQIHQTGEAAFIDSLSGNYYSTHMVKVEVPAELESLPESTLKAVQVEGQWVIQLDEVKAVQLDKGNRIQEKYDLLQTEVYAEMTKVFLTTKSDSATANLETWKRMVANPGIFSGEGLLCKYSDLTGFDAGSPLDTNEKVIDYAEQLLAKADVYAVWREKRIQTFSAEKAAIEAEL